MNTTSPTLSITTVENIVETSAELLNRLQGVNERLARVIGRAVGFSPESDAGVAVPPRSEGLLHRAGEEINQAHDVVGVINGQIDTIETLI